MNRDKLIKLIEQVPIQICGALRSDYADAIADALIANGIGDIATEKARADRAEKALEVEKEALERVQGIALNIIHENAYDTDILLKRAIKAGVKVDDLLCCPHTNSKKQAYEKQLQQADKEGE